MSTELVAIERIIIGKGEKGAEQVRKDLARYLRQFLDTASIESMSLSAMVIKLDGKTALDIHNKTGGKGLDGLDTRCLKAGYIQSAANRMTTRSQGCSIFRAGTQKEHFAAGKTSP